MTVYFYDGSTMIAREIEIGKDCFIINGYRTVKFYEVLRIVAGER